MIQNAIRAFELVCFRVPSGCPTRKWGRWELRQSGWAVRTGRAQWAWSTRRGRRLRWTRRWRIWARGSWRTSRQKWNGVRASFIQFILIPDENMEVAHEKPTFIKWMKTNPECLLKRRKRTEYRNHDLYKVVVWRERCWSWDFFFWYVIKWVPEALMRGDRVNV